MSQEVYIRDVGVRGEIMSQMAYGAIVRYAIGGIEHYELMSDEDYEDLDHMFFDFGGKETNE